MAKTQQSKAKAANRKPHPDFPLFPHARGYWAKKVRGKLIYFGKIADDTKGEAALNLWVDQKDDLLAGRTPRVHRDGLQIRDLCNQFLTAKQQLVDSREISPRTFADYFATCSRLCSFLGKERLVEDLASDDFEGLRAALAKTWGPVAVGNEVGRLRVVFKYGYDAGLIDKPVRYGPHFKRPSKRVLRQSRAAKGPRMFEAQDIRKLLEKATQPLRAMILLGINCGLGNADIGQLERRHVDFAGAWLDYPRPKTGVGRRAKLWPETVSAIKDVIADRPTHRAVGDADLVFITKYGGRWSKDTSENPISREFGKLLLELKMNRPGLGFYALRHTFETIGGECLDQVAVNHAMGHSPESSDMASVYRERVSDDRLIAVSEFVRKWLFAKPKWKATTKAASKPRTKQSA